MRLIVVILFSLTMLFSKDISEKLIVSGDENSTMAHAHLLKLKMAFIGNPQTRVLQEKYKLHLETETFNEYTMVVIKPIRSLALKNELLLYLSPLFPNIFSIEDHQRESIRIDDIETIQTYIAPSHGNKVIDQGKVLMQEIGVEWIALLLLSFSGLILSLNSRRKMENLGNIQEDLSRKQEEIEIEIKHLGASGV